MPAKGDHYYCDQPDCDGEAVFESRPSQPGLQFYMHKCGKCGAEYGLLLKYPLVRKDPLDDEEDDEEPPLSTFTEPARRVPEGWREV